MLKLCLTSIKLLLLIGIALSTLNIYSQCSSSFDNDFDNDHEPSDWNGAKMKPLNIPITITSGTVEIMNKSLSKKLGKKEHYELLQTWSNPRTGFFINMEYHIPRSKFDLGLSFSEIQLIKPYKETIANASTKQYFHKKAKINNYSLYSDINIFQNRRSKLYIRGILGITNYTAKATVTEKDSCGCYEVLEKEKISQNSFNPAIGIGYKWKIKDFIGFNITIIKNTQSISNFSNESNFKEWSKHQHSSPKGNQYKIDKLKMIDSKIAANHLSFQAGISINLNPKPITNSIGHTYYAYITSYLPEQLNQDELNKIAQSFNYNKLFLTQLDGRYYIYSGEHQNLKSVEKLIIKAHSKSYIQNDFIGKLTTFKNL
jgi:hypothetical protein